MIHSMPFWYSTAREIIRLNSDGNLKKIGEFACFFLWKFLKFKKNKKKKKKKNYRKLVVKIKGTRNKENK